VTDFDVDLFAGPGGWDEAARLLGRRPIGIELDAAACLTRAAAGHRTVRADVSAFPLERLAGRVRGLAGSPPCTTFSAAGDGAGNAVTGHLAELARYAFAGHDKRDAHRRMIVADLAESGWPGKPMSPEDRAAKIERAAASAVLVAEPARFIAAGRPEWIALEQVPAVLPLWQVYAEELRLRGYSAWCGKLNAADYGVPQTRERAILIASRVRAVSRPQPTHYDPRKGLQLWGTPWVSMAEALGWDEPAPTITSAGGKAGANLSWVLERPSTTVQGDPRIGHPGHKDREGGESQFAQDAVRISVREAAMLQSFRPDYPWQGSKTAQFQQVGNAVPPLLALHVLSMATGIPLPLSVTEAAA
jgi:DNA (cytosine-5)-methyltransferase 1